MSKAEECVKVMVRVRPMNKTEKARDCKGIVSCDQKTRSIEITSELNGNSIQKQFSYD